jgi:hypothetical protein
MMKSWIYRVSIFLLGCIVSILAVNSWIWTSHPAQAEDVDLPMTPITAVSQLEDLSPSDPYFAAVKALTEQYGCISGFSDNTFRPEKPVTRGEVVIVLHTCLQKMAELIRSGAFDS